MLEKRIDKDNLINKLHDYLKEEVLEIATSITEEQNELEKLNNKKKSMIEEANKQSGIYQIRRVFSPLSFDNQEETQEVQVDTSEVDKEINNIEHVIREKIAKKQMLTDYLASLEENYFIVDIDTSDNDENVPFLPAFYKLMDHIKLIHPEIRIDYEKKDEESKALMNFSFLKGFESCMKFFIYNVGVTSIKTEIYIDKNRILIQFKAYPKFMEDINGFMSQRAKLESMLPKEYSVIKWKTSLMMTEAFLNV